MTYYHAIIWHILVSDFFLQNQKKSSLNNSPDLCRHVFQNVYPYLSIMQSLSQKLNICQYT